MTKDNMPNIINRCTITKCLKLLKYFSEHPKASFGVMEIDPRVNDAIYLLKVILNRESCNIPYRDIQQLTKKRFPKVDTLKVTLDLLEEREIIKKRTVNNKQVIFVNPHLIQSGKGTPITPNIHKLLPDEDSILITNTTEGSPFPPTALGGNGEKSNYPNLNLTPLSDNGLRQIGGNGGKNN